MFIRPSKKEEQSLPKVYISEAQKVEEALNDYNMSQKENVIYKWMAEKKNLTIAATPPTRQPTQTERI